MRRRAPRRQGGTGLNLGWPPLASPSWLADRSRSRFDAAQNQRYPANGFRYRYLITAAGSLGTRIAPSYPLNGDPGAEALAGTNARETALADSNTEQSV